MSFHIPKLSFNTYTLAERGYSGFHHPLTQVNPLSPLLGPPPPILGDLDEGLVSRQTSLYLFRDWLEHAVQTVSHQ